jgi:hypothetical protein
MPGDSGDLTRSPNKNVSAKLWPTKLDRHSSSSYKARQFEAESWPNNASTQSVAGAMVPLPMPLIGVLTER